MQVGKVLISNLKMREPSLRKTKQLVQVYTTGKNGAVFQILGHRNISSFKPHDNITSTPILKGNFKRTVQPAPFVVVQSFSRVQLFVTPWTAACQVSLYFTMEFTIPQYLRIFGDKVFNGVIKLNELVRVGPNAV